MPSSGTSTDGEGGASLGVLVAVCSLRAALITIGFARPRRWLGLDAEDMATPQAHAAGPRRHRALSCPRRLEPATTRARKSHCNQSRAQGQTATSTPRNAPPSPPVEVDLRKKSRSHNKSPLPSSLNLPSRSMSQQNARSKFLMQLISVS